MATIPDDLIEARIPPYVEAMDDLVNQLVGLHREIGRRHGAEIPKHPQAEAVWELSGHALVLARAYVFLLRYAYIPPDVVLARALHETLLAVGAATDPENSQIHDQYLTDRPLKAETVRKAVQMTQRRAEASGLKVDRDLRSTAQSIYQGLSGYSHNKRSAIGDSISSNRVFVYGPHPDAGIRASHVLYGAVLLEQAAIEISMALSRMPGFEGAYDAIGQPFSARLAGLRIAFPLEGESEG